MGILCKVKEMELKTGMKLMEIITENNYIVYLEKDNRFTAKEITELYDSYFIIKNAKQIDDKTYYVKYNI